MLGPVIDGDDVAAGRLEGAVALAQRPFGLVPAIGLAAGDLNGEVHALEPRPGRRLGPHGREVEAAVGRVDQDPLRRAQLADAAGERAGVDAADARKAHGREPGVEMLEGAEVGRIGDVGPQDEAARRGRDGLHVLLVGADVADMREGEGDDLGGVGGVGQNLLIARHRGVEADLSDRRALRTQAPTPIESAVGEDQRRRGARWRAHVRWLELRLGHARRVLPIHAPVGSPLVRAARKPPGCWIRPREGALPNTSA